MDTAPPLPPLNIMYGHIFTHDMNSRTLQTILFTTDKDILLRVAEHDETFQGEVGSRDSDEEGAESSRPGTGDGGEGSDGGDGGDGGEHDTSGRGRPFTASSQHSQTDPTAQLVSQGEGSLPSLRAADL